MSAVVGVVEEVALTPAAVEAAPAAAEVLTTSVLSQKFVREWSFGFVSGHDFTACEKTRFFEGAQL
jgi:hypothetical protein